MDNIYKREGKNQSVDGSREFSSFPHAETGELSLTLAGSSSNQKYYGVSLSESEKEYIGELNLSPAGSSSKKYYGVSLSESGKEYTGESFVFSNLLDLQTHIKKFPDSRFKVFGTYEEAVAYTSVSYSTLTSSSSGASASVILDEKSFFYKSLSSQELVSLRKTIETGNETAFYNLVWSNPRYLVNSNDCPTTLQAGTHSNALHIVSRYLQTDLCVAVLNTLYDLRFISLLYPDEVDPSMLEIKRKRIMDLYLNTADKSLGETPLHYASKFGAVEIVRILLSYEWTEKDKLNKFDKRPFDIICDRAKSQIHSEELKSKIQSLFQDSSCVPILRDLSNAVEPIFGEPCASYVKEDVTWRKIKEEGDSRKKKEKLLPSAFVGPMSTSDAKTFYLTCKKKNFSELLPYSVDDEKEFKEICRSDPIKGLERVGRKIAKDFSYEWIEFWPVLSVWVNISSNYGLNLLECHLRCQTELKMLLDCKQMPTLNMDERCDSLAKLLEKGLVHSFCNIVDRLIEKTQSHEINHQNFLHLFQSLMPETFCMTKYTFSNSEFIKDIHKEISHIIYLKLSSQSNITENILHEFIMQINAKLNFNSFSSESKNWKFLLCIVRYMIFLHHTRDCQTDTPCISLACKPTCFCDWICESDSYIFDSTVAYYKFVKIRQDKERDLLSLDAHNKVILEKRSDSKESFLYSAEASLPGPSQTFSSPTSKLDLKACFAALEPFKISPPFTEICAPDDSNLSLSDEEFFTPPETPPEDIFTPQFKHKSPSIYINGSEISDDDIDLFRAVENIPINGIVHPNLYKWKTLMETELQQFLRPVSELSRTPASASATLKRRMKERDVKIRRSLF